MNSYDVKIINERKLHHYKVMMFSMAIVTVFCIGLAVICIDLACKYDNAYSNIFNKYKTVCEDYLDLRDQYTTLYESYSKMYTEYMGNLNYSRKCEETIAGLSETVEELDQQNISLVKSNDEYFNLIQQYEEREELFDKYEYAIQRTNGTRTDITYDQLKTLELLAEEKDVDTDLVLSITMVESSGIEDAVSTESTARGYGQILAGTGKMVYEKLMKEGKYNHDYALNGNTNLRMMVYYLRYLEDNNITMYATIKGYRGEGGSILDDYIVKINNYLKYSGKSVSTLK